MLLVQSSVPLGMAYFHVLLCNNMALSTLKMLSTVRFFLSFLKIFSPVLSDPSSSGSIHSVLMGLLKSGVSNCVRSSENAEKWLKKCIA